MLDTSSSRMRDRLVNGTDINYHLKGILTVKNTETINLQGSIHPYT